METCHFNKAWVGKCDKPAVENGMCEEHKDMKCCSCGAPATHECSETGQFVCGALLCNDCEHTTHINGFNGGVGFFRLSKLPEGMKEHCKKADQKVFPWYVKDLGNTHPEIGIVLDKFNKKELTYLEADKQINEICETLNNKNESD